MIDNNNNNLLHLYSAITKYFSLHSLLMILFPSIFSVELWAAKMQAGHGTDFSTLMAGGEKTGKKVNCFLEMFK